MAPLSALCHCVLLVVVQEVSATCIWPPLGSSSMPPVGLAFGEESCILIFSMFWIPGLEEYLLSYWMTAVPASHSVHYLLRALGFRVRKSSVYLEQATQVMLKVFTSKFCCTFSLLGYPGGPGQFLQRHNALGNSHNSASFS